MPPFAVLEQVSAYSCPVVVTGDLNLQLDVVGGSDARRLQEVLDTFGLSLSVGLWTNAQRRTHARRRHLTGRSAPADDRYPFVRRIFRSLTYNCFVPTPTATTPSTICRC